MQSEINYSLYFYLVNNRCLLKICHQKILKSNFFNFFKPPNYTNVNEQLN